jgi:hypothetical protein
LPELISLAVRSTSSLFEFDPDVFARLLGDEASTSSDPELFADE